MKQTYIRGNAGGKQVRSKYGQNQPAIDMELPEVMLVLTRGSRG